MTRLGKTEQVPFSQTFPNFLLSQAQFQKAVRKVQKAKNIGKDIHAILNTASEYPQ